MPGEAESRWQLLAEHLVGVARRAEHLALETGAGEAFAAAARWAGVLHDVGKYQHDFQRMLLDVAAGRPKSRVPHSAHGAAIALDALAADVAFAVAGHHAGLPAPQGGRSALKERCDEARAVSHELLEVARADLEAWQPGTADLLYNGLPATHGRMRGTTADLHVRMLASCLVDADRLDTAGEARTVGNVHEAGALLDRLLRHVTTLAATTRVAAVRDVRREVLDACLLAAEWPERLLSLTVPTGGGKTLASMALALRRVQAGLARRIIVVIPYLSIIEQNAQIYADLLGVENVLEHHSGMFEDVDRDEDQDALSVARRLAQENWDMPIVVTTSVRFFESLFSNRTGDLRRLHNIAHSVVVLDEVQTLPRQLIGTLLSMMRGLADQWNTTFVFCTATQPAFERAPERIAGGSDALRWPRGTVREVIPEPRALFDRLRRVQVQWVCGGPHPERWSWDRVAEEMASVPRVLAIVNMKKHAEVVHDILRARGDVRGDRLWCLTTRMCAAHRLDVLARIRDALREGADCRVVATQLVEAGVDLDFPIVLRALGPLDSIAQAAGRCDREGTLTAELGSPGGRLVVFEPELSAGARATPRGAYTDGTRVTAGLIAGGGVRIDDPVQLLRYFERLFHGAELDAGRFEELRGGLQFPLVAENFQMIESVTTPVLVRYGAGERLIDELVGRRSVDRHLLRRLQRYQVGLYDDELAEARRVGAVMSAWPGSEILVCTPGCYGDRGLRLESDLLLDA
jgi:CRISPR-associated endonuclease/helicase Cas3